jgi:hypothetical protein
VAVLVVDDRDGQAASSPLVDRAVAHAVICCGVLDCTVRGGASFTESCEVDKSGGKDCEQTMENRAKTWHARLSNAFSRRM